MNKSKKLLCAFLAFIMVLSAAPLSAFAAASKNKGYNNNTVSRVVVKSDVKSEDGLWNYSLYEDKNQDVYAWIDGFNGEEETLKIPSFVDGYTVMAVDAFFGVISDSSAKDKVKKIIVPEGVGYIGHYSFSNLNDVEFVLPSTLKMIDFRAFYKTKIKSVNLPEGIEAISKCAFDEAEFEDGNVILPESLKYLGYYAFRNSNIKSVSIGKNTDILNAIYSQTAGVVTNDRYVCAASPFENCKALEKISVDKRNPYIKMKDDVLYTADMSSLVQCLKDCDEFIVPNSIERIAYYAFYNKTFKHLRIGSGIKNLERKMLFGAKIGKLDFDPDFNMSKFDQENLRGVNIQSIVIPASVTEISAFTFSDSSLKNLSFEKDSRIQTIYACAFEKGKLENVDFSNCSALLKIDGFAFSNNKNLKTVDLSSTSLSVLEGGAFEYCSSLETVKLPKTLKSISYSAFYKDENLKEINLENVIECNTSAFEKCDNFKYDSGVISSGEYGDYKYNEYSDHVAITAYTGKDTDLVIPDEINSKPVTFVTGFSCVDLNSVQLPSKLEVIGAQAFMYTDLKELGPLPKTLKYIGEHAFSNSKFTSVTLPEGLEFVGSCAFQWCPLESLTIPDSVTFFDGGSLYKTMKNVTFGANVKNIQYLLSCKELPQAFDISEKNPWYSSEYGILYNKDKTRLIKDYPAFNKAEKPKEYKIPSCVETIDDRAFESDKSIKKIIIPSSVKHLGYYAFCSSKVEEAIFEDGFSSPILYATFYKALQLRKVSMSKDAKVKTLYYTYAQTSLENAPIPDRVKTIWAAFSNSDVMGDIVLPEGLKVLGTDSFYETRIRSVSFPDSLEKIGDGAFYGCKKLNQINFNKVKRLGRASFGCCTSIAEVDLSGVSYISEKVPEAAFVGCKNLKKITYKKESERSKIEENECSGMTSLNTVVIGNSVDEIKKKAFSDCENLEKAYIAESVKKISETAFTNCKKLKIICTKNSEAMLFAKRNNIPYQTFHVDPVPNQIYTGHAIMPVLNVSHGGKELKLNKDYKTTY